MTPEEAMKDAAEGHPNNLLEALRRALGTLKDPKCPFRFDDWGVCTCGHVYVASKRTAGFDGLSYRDTLAINHPSPRSMHGRMLNAIIAANGLPKPGDIYSAAYRVSDATEVLARKRSGRGRAPSTRSLRNAAITLLEKAVAYVEQQERDAMLLKGAK